MELNSFRYLAFNRNTLDNISSMYVSESDESVGTTEDSTVLENILSNIGSTLKKQQIRKKKVNFFLHGNIKRSQIQAFLKSKSDQKPDIFTNLRIITCMYQLCNLFAEIMHDYVAFRSNFFEEMGILR